MSKMLACELLYVDVVTGLAFGDILLSKGIQTLVK